jgi:hypothetical protein
MKCKLLISLAIVVILTIGITILQPLFALQLYEDKLYYSEECDYLTEEELSKLNFSNPDPCSSNLDQEQNYSSVTSTALKSILASLDQAITAFDEGNLSGSLQQLDRTEDEIDIVEDRIEFQLGIE